MLPFLKAKEASVSMPAEAVKRKPDEGADMDYLEGCMAELSAALKSGDAKAASAAFRAAFQVCESEPHEEGEHIG